jgi:adenylate cyclase
MVDGARPLVDDVRRATDRGLLTANLIGGVVVAGYFEATAVPATHPLGDWSDPALVVGYAAFLALALRLFRRRRFAPATRWALEERAPDEDERAATLALPRVVGRAHLLLWLNIAVSAAGFNYLTHRAAGLALRTLLGISFVALAVALLSSLLVERSLRPLFAQLFAGRPPERTAVVGIRRRLLLFWAMGSGIPLLGVLLTPLGLPGSDHDRIVVGMLVLGGIGLGFGLFFTVVAAASVADPVADVRDAMRRVADGDLHAEVPVDDDGEVGLLQAGFNHMADGLRQRERLQELFGRHVGEEVARRALDQGVELGGEQRDVSALFVDLIGSTKLAYRRDPAEVVAVLNRFFAAVISTVEAEGGWVNKFEGDGALCVFGAPVDQPDHAARVLRAARDLHRRLAAAGVDAAIGVSSGMVVAGNVGSERRSEYTVIGDPVNEAARLTDLAKTHPGRVLASAATVSRSGNGGAWTAFESVVLRGRDEPTQTFALS